MNVYDTYEETHEQARSRYFDTITNTDTLEAVAEGIYQAGYVAAIPKNADPAQAARLKLAAIALDEWTNKLRSALADRDVEMIGEMVLLAVDEYLRPHIEADRR